MKNEEKKMKKLGKKLYKKVGKIVRKVKLNFNKKQKPTNPFDAIIDIYNKGVAEADKLGFADKFKESAERFFRVVAADFIDDSQTVTFEDIDYRDGYFLIGFGTNSIVHFHIKECPGWLFAIWWKMPETEAKDTNVIEGTFFTQYEETLDKFKPSRSEFKSEIGIYFDEPDEEFSVSCYGAMEIINFIIKEPYLAFCRDYNSWDYNTEFHTREEAKAEYDKYVTWRDNKIKYSTMYDQKIVDFVREHVMTQFKGAILYDEGENCSPRYQILAPYSLNKDLVDEPGDYGWFDDEDEDGKRITAEFDALCEEADKCSDEYSYMWYSPVSNDVVMYDDSIIKVTEDGEVIRLDETV